MGAEAWSENLGSISSDSGPQCLQVSTGDKKICLCVLVHTCHPRAWKEDSKANLGYSVKIPSQPKKQMRNKREEKLLRV